MGNADNEEQFKLNFDYLASELYRVMIQGRCVALHCTDIPAMKERDGYIGLKDFPALLRESMEQAGFIYHSKITIWKNPVVEVTRTKAIGLLHKQLKKDSTRCRVGLPDYVIVMRKPGENPEPVLHTDEEFSVDAWQLVASPVWNHIHQTRTLNSIKAEKDERHVCPLQLDTIRDLLRLYSNPDDLIFSPFAGIGSEGYVSLKMGRRFLGIELKPEYYTEAISNLRSATVEAYQELLI
jgi:DNA modification methylase